MWTVVYMSKDENNIALIKDKIASDDIIVMTRKCDDFFELLVPSEEMSKAHDIIIEAEL